jgi:hypothetical protein
VKVTIIYEDLPSEDLPSNDRKWVRITKTDDGRISSRTRHCTKEAVEQGAQPADDNIPVKRGDDVKQTIITVTRSCTQRQTRRSGLLYARLTKESIERGQTTNRNKLIAVEVGL